MCVQVSKEGIVHAVVVCAYKVGCHCACRMGHVESCMQVCACR